MTRSIKTAISLPAETFRRAEKIRRKNGRSRSELYAAALELYLRTLEVRDLEAVYEAGYRKRPETPEDIQAALQASTEALQAEDW